MADADRDDRAPRSWPLRPGIVAATAVVVAIAVVAIIALSGGGGGGAPAGSVATTTAATGTTPGSTSGGSSTSVEDGVPTTTVSTSEPTTTRPPATTVPVPAASSTTPGAGSVANGVWGGPRAILTITDAGGTLELECASGTLPGPLRTDQSGRFQAQGTYTAAQGGPAQPSTTSAQPTGAVYSGTVSGARMQLTISLPASGTELGPFALGLGQHADLSRCG